MFRTAAAMGHRAWLCSLPLTAVQLHTAALTSRSPSIRTWIPPRFCARPNASAPSHPPGYGFLSESRTSFRPSSDAGLIWIRADCRQHSSDGVEGRARELADRAGVPQLTSGTDKFPVLVGLKPAVAVRACGGWTGPGPRRSDRSGQTRSSQFLRRRHRVQLSATSSRHGMSRYRYSRDTHGNVVHLFERNA